MAEIRHVERPERPDNPFRLGQKLVLDPASKGFAVETTAQAVQLQNRSWNINIPVLDQGNVGSCVGNTGTEEVAADPIYETLPSDLRATLDEQYALRLYSDATKIDGVSGTYLYPPGSGDDTGTSGLAMEKVLKRRGVISSYHWAMSVHGVVVLLQRGPVAQGCAWYQKMFDPDRNGFVTPGGDVAGGHETLIFAVELGRADNFDDAVFTIRNHWGTGWGDAGCYRMTGATMKRLQQDQADWKQGRPVAA